MPRYETTVLREAPPEVKLRMAWPTPLPVTNFEGLVVEHTVIHRRSRLNLVGTTDALYIICGGVLFEDTVTPSGNPAVTAVWRKGGMFLPSEITGQLRSGPSNVELVKVVNWHGYDLLRQHVIAHRINTLLRVKRELAACKEDTILARIRRYSAAQDYELDLSFTDAARELGCSRESFSREFNRLKGLHEKRKETENDTAKTL